MGRQLRQHLRLTRLSPPLADPPVPLLPALCRQSPTSLQNCCIVRSNWGLTRSGGSITTGDAAGSSLQPLSSVTPGESRPNRYSGSGSTFLATQTFSDSSRAGGTTFRRGFWSLGSTASRAVTFWPSCARVPEWRRWNCAFHSPRRVISVFPFLLVRPSRCAIVRS